MTSHRHLQMVLVYQLVWYVIAAESLAQGKT